jgi:hypothetical protein
MRIVEDSTHRLTLESRPWILGTVLAIVILFMLFLALVYGRENIWGGIGMGLGAALFGAAFVAFVRRVIVIFDQDAQAVVIRTASLLGQDEQTLALQDILGAVVETSISRSGSAGSGRSSTSRTHRPVLQLPSGPVPLTQIYSGGKGASAAVEAINRWLAGTRPDRNSH